MKQTRIGSELITPAIAKNIIENEMYERQRPLRASHVDELAHHMKNGTFIENTVIIFAVLDGQRKLVNGQHTVSAIIKSGCDIQLMIQEYSCRNEDEIASLYGRQDKHIRRTEGDTFHSLDLHAKWDLRKEDMSHLSAAVKVIGRGFAIGGGNSDIRFRDVEGFLVPLMDEWRPTFTKVLSWLDGAQSRGKRFVCSSQVLPVIMWVARHYKDQAKAKDFVFELANDSGLHRNDPRRILWDVHLALKLDPYQRRTRYRHFNRYVAATWNSIESGKWSKTRKFDPERRGRTIGKNMKVSGTPKPLPLPLDYFISPIASKSTAKKSTVNKKTKKTAAKANVKN